MKRMGMFLGNWAVIAVAPIWVPLVFWFAVLREKQFEDARSGKRWFFNVV